MKLKFLTTKGEEYLYKNIGKNLEYYEGLKTENDIISHAKKEIREVEKNISDCTLTSDMGKRKEDLIASIRLFNSYNSLTPLQASDSRFWAFQCHFEHYDYVNSRWKVDRFKKDPIGTVKSRYFIRNRRDLSRNALSRLWWAAFLTVDRKNENDPYWRTRVLFKNQDMYAQLMERSISNSKVLLNNILEAVHMMDEKYPDLIGKVETQKLVKYISLSGGRKLLDFLTKKEIDNLTLDFYVAVNNDEDFVSRI